MIAAVDKLVLRARGRDHGGVLAATVSRSLEDFPSSFFLDLAEVYKGEANSLGIRTGDPCEIRIGGELVLTGYAERPRRTRTAGSISVSMTGRSKGCDLADCSCVFSPAQWRQRTMTAIARDLCEHYSIDVLDDVGLSDKIRRFATEAGEKVYEALDRLAQDQSVILMDNPAGDLVITRAPVGTAPVATIKPGHFISISVETDASERFSEYRVKGNHAGTDEAYGASVAGIEAIILDDELDRPRVLVIKGKRQMDQASAKARAIWEAVIRAGRSVTVSIVMPGYRDGNGNLWEPNKIVRVDCPGDGVQADLVLKSVVYNHSNEGRTSDLVLVPQGAYEPEPPMTRKKGKITKGIGQWEREFIGSLIGNV